MRPLRGRVERARLLRTNAGMLGAAQRVIAGYHRRGAQSRRPTQLGHRLQHDLLLRLLSHEHAIHVVRARYRRERVLVVVGAEATLEG